MFRGNSCFLYHSRLCPAREGRRSHDRAHRDRLVALFSTGLACVLIATAVFRAQAAPLDLSQLPPPAARTIDFTHDIQPLFSSACLKCHGAENPKSGFALTSKARLLQGGDRGVDVVPGDSAKSPLVHFIARLVEDMEMPPTGKGAALSSEQIGLVRAWIDQGAVWPESAVVRSTNATIHEIATERPHWALQPIMRPALPLVTPSEWGRNPIDRFILARLEATKLTPSTEADPLTLVRRLYFTLIGLPPAPEEIARFLADDSGLAYENLVDRLLASPHYGERWARHWLDVVRFAESHGFEMNAERPNAWPYRDYVIRAFNDDKPYDQFVIEQLAGDAVGADEATGFLVGGAYDAVKSPDINLTSQQRMDELHDMVATTGSAFLGLTVGCARCHNHKFDPISQQDYYAMQAVFAGVQHGERVRRPVDYSERMAQAKDERETLARLQLQLLSFAPVAQPLRGSAGRGQVPQAKLNIEEFEPLLAKAVRFTVYHTADGAEPCLDELEVFGVAAPDRNLALASPAVKLSASGTYPDSALHKLEHLNDGRYGNARSWISNERGRGWVEIDLAEPAQIHRVLWGRDREGGYKDRLSTVYSIEVLSESNTWHQVAGQAPRRPAVNSRQNVDRFPPVQARFVRFNILATTGAEPALDELEVYSTESPPRNLALATLGAKATTSGTFSGSPFHTLEHLNDGQFGNAHSWVSDHSGKGWVQLEFPELVRIDRVVWGRDRDGQFTDRLATEYQIETALTPGDWQVVANERDRESYQVGAEPVLVLATTGLSSVETNQLNRLLADKRSSEQRLKALTSFPMLYAGRFEQPGPTYRLQRGEPLQKREQIAPGGLQRVTPELTLPAETPEQQRRLALARWLTDSNNPLTARVLVNRLWQHHFGQGLVSTPSDFGRMGGAPSHPDLLDWLASEFRDSGWSIKHVQRLIVLSATYRQASTPRSNALAADASARLLWRFPPRRLEAEPVRDTILAVSGVLDLRMGGRGFDLFEPNDNYVKVYTPKHSFGPGEWRRMVYLAKPRMRLDDTFGAFDCPDAGQAAPRRMASTTPLQALSFLNSPFMTQQAELFADRVRREAGAIVESEVERAFLLAFGRRPSALESASAVALAQKDGLKTLCRALLNANEFIYVF